MFPSPGTSMAQPRRQRLRYEGLDFEVFPDGRCRAGVTLEWSGERFRASAEGMSPMDGSLRTAALATLDAAALASGGRLSLELSGVKSMRAFDTLVAVVSIRARTEEREYRLIGVKAADDEEPVETAARAVLDGLNRVLELYVPRNPRHPEDVRPRGERGEGPTPDPSHGSSGGASATT